MEPEIQIVAPRGRDAEVIAGVLAPLAIRTAVCPDLATLVPLLPGCGAVVVTEEALAGASLDAVLTAVEGQPPWSDLPFLVLATKQARPRGQAQTIVLERLGNAMLLERPLNPDTLRRATRSALRARARQIAVRDMNATLEGLVEQRTAALAESEARLLGIFEGFPDSLYVVRVERDGEMRFIFESYNRVAEEMSGYRSADIAGQPAEAFMPPETAAEVTARFRRCVAEGRSIHSSGEIRFAAGTRAYDTVITPIHDAQGRVMRLLGVARDVTERNRLEARLRQAQKLEAVGHLTGGVAHDFNNLLQVVLSGLTLMERVQSPERRAQLAESVRRAAQRGGELTKRLLTVARRQSLRPVPIDLASWLDDGAGELLSRALRGDIALEKLIPPGLPPLQADPAELELALLNIAVNARDAMPEGGTLRIIADLQDVVPGNDAEEVRGRFVRIAVSDTGTGMSEEVLARVFEPFFTTKGVGQGTGLGLAQVYGFVQQSGGVVRLRSKQGQGTTVQLLLPVSDVAAAEPVAAPADAPAVSGRAVLVVEDDEDVAALVLDMLQQLGHRPTRVSTAAAALGALADGRAVDMLFTDVMMPGGMDGLALAREAGRRRPGLPVVLTTGYTGGGAADVPLGLPVLRKPYQIDELARTLNKALARTRP